MSRVPLPAYVGRLRRVRRLGAGAFATVWLYHDDDLDSDVAIKALAENWADELDIAERFVKEARVLRGAASEHVVAVHDIGAIEDGAPYFVMTYADLGTVADLAQEGPVDITTTVEVIGQAAIGLSDLHASGVVHRDVKPSNLLLRSDRRLGRRVLVADLGMAKALAVASGITRLVGTPAYMAPEQARRGEAVNESSDTYALGAVAYRLLTGFPVRDNSLTEVEQAAPPQPLGNVTRVSKPLSDVVMRALEVDPDRRWPDPLRFAAALRSAVDDDDTRSGPTRTVTEPLPPPTKAATPPDRPAAKPRMARSTRGLLAVAGAAVVAAAVLAVWWASAAGDGADGPAAGSKNTVAVYCQTVRDNREGLQTLLSSDPQEFRRSVSAVHEIRQAAPPEVADAWAALDDPLRELQSTLQAHHTTWQEYSNSPDEADPEVVAAVSKFAAQLRNADDVRKRIATSIQRQCG